MEYRQIKVHELGIQLFSKFRRHQVVEQCFRKVNGKWVVKDVPFIDLWSDEDYVRLINDLKNTIHTGGIVYGSFIANNLKGFVSVENDLFGINEEYLNLSNLHVSEDVRGQGIGKRLFDLAVSWAKVRGAKKLYISAHSAVETQAFYRGLGCREAIEYNQKYVIKEPFDCQLEYVF